MTNFWEKIFGKTAEFEETTAAKPVSPDSAEAKASGPEERKFTGYFINELPEVTLLYIPRWKLEKLGGVGKLSLLHRNCFGKSWERSEDRGDYYVVEIIDNSEKKDNRTAAERFKAAIEKELEGM
jgi:hypothetical protein